ncbi:MAG: hypothetical protein JO314_04165 [Acidobacteria bacterium]|nr:hypothetical protein [Acidobacteriota bacterium]
MKFRFHPEAETEVEAASDFYDEREFGVGELFLIEVRETIARIVRHLTRGQRILTEPVDACAITFHIRSSTDTTKLK